jgi:hypothetical protein
MSLHLKRKMSDVLAMFVFCIDVQLQLCIFVKICRQYKPPNKPIEIDFMKINKDSQN